MFIMSLIVAVFTAACIAVMQNLLEDVKFSKENKVQYFTGNNPYLTVGIGVLAGAVNYLAAMAEGMLWITPILALVITGLFGFLVAYWHKEGSDFKEMIPFWVLTLIFWLIAKSVFCAMGALFMSDQVARIIEAIPNILAVATIAIFLIDLFLYRQELSGKSYRCLSVIVAVVALLGIGCFGASALDLSAKDDAASEAYAADTGKTKTTWEGLHYYNDEVRDDDNYDNNYDFGPNPFVEGQNVDYYVENFEARRSEDPALLSATALALDSVVNTDYIGEILYAGYNKKLTVLERADAATRVMAEDKDIFDANNEAISKMLGSAKSVKLVKESKISDQLYMNGYTASDIPQIVVYESDVTSDWCLVYTFQVKSSEVRIAFRIPCGYQWTNPYEVLNTPAYTKPAGNKGGKGDGPPDHKYKKDSSQDSVNNGNANTYGGKNKADNGTGDYKDKPSKDSGSNAGSGGSSSGSSGDSGGQGSKPSDPGGSGRTDPIPPHRDSHDSGGSENNGEFVMK